MSQSMLPPQMAYAGFRPKGYYTQFKQWPITPMSSNQFWLPEQIVRFLITIKSGVMDPYRSHLQVTVSVPLDICPVGGMQVDNSAQSFIAQTVVSSHNTEIQRITQYDTLAAYLTDIGFSQYVCESRVTQGLGYSNIPSHSPYSSMFNNPTQVQVSNAPNVNILENLPTGLIMPSRMPTFGGKGQSMINGQGLQSNFLTNANTTVIPSLTNIIWQPQQAYGINGILNACGRLNNVRSQYASLIMNSNYPDTPSSLLQTSPNILNQIYTAQTMNQNLPNSGFNPKNPYQVGFRDSYSTNQVNSYTGANTYPVYYPTTCNLYGFQKALCSQFVRGTGQALLSPTIPQCQMQNGLILPYKVPVWTQMFRIPLISAICGILIPPDQFLLIPMASLYNLLLQITLSRYAMFSTGYSDVHQLDQRGMQTPIPRKWIISQISWNLHLYTFSDQGVNRQIEASLVKNIPISTTSYTLASQFQLPNGQSVRNSWPIGTQAESLCQIICIFLSNQYNQYPFCRKQFRLSNCISSMQIKLNTDYYPSQPIIGNAGNPQALDTTGDAWPFYEQILLSSNFLFNTNIPLPKINIKNFAVNARCYNVNNRNTMFDKDMLHNPNYTFTSNSVNLDTAMGYTHFHENRYIGKSAFVYCWQPYGHSKQYMTGINTQGIQNFSVIFNTIPTNPYPYDETLLIYTRQNTITIYTAQGIKVIGK